MPFSTTRRGALAALGGTAAAATLAAPAIAQNRSVVVGALRFTSHSPSFIALERGYFADAGLDAELRFFEAAQPMSVAIASGDVDYAVTAMSGSLISLADRGAIKVIGGALSEEPGIDGQKILASNDAHAAGLTSPAALDGRSFGVTTPGSSFHYMGSRVAQAEGATLAFTPLQTVGAVIGALRSGQIDAWSIVPHIASALSGAEAVQVIGEIADYLPNYQVTTLFTSTDRAANERAATEAFVAAFAQGAADYNAAMVDATQGEDARDGMVDLIHQYVYTDRPRERAAPSIIAGSMRINEGAALNTTSLQDQLSWFQEESLVDADISLETIVDDSYVEVG